MSYSIQDYAFLKADRPSTPGVDAFEAIGDPCHYRSQFSAPIGNGQTEFCGLADGLFVQISDVRYSKPSAMWVSAPNMLRIRIASDGDAEYAPAWGDPLHMRGPCAAIIIEPPGLPPAQAVMAGNNRAVHVYVHRDRLIQLYEQSEEELPSVLQPFIAGALQRTITGHLPLGPSLLRCLEDLLGCELEGRGRRLFIYSKAVEILCHAFDVLAREEGHGSSEASELATRAVLKAQQLLMANFVTPPSLDDLARQVGLSRSRLCTSFRQVLGQTVFDHIADLRMQHALVLLRQQDASITQIGYEVGYTHSSSFSAAVQRRFGVSPSELRRRGLSPRLDAL